MLHASLIHALCFTSPCFMLLHVYADLCMLFANSCLILFLPWLCCFMPRCFLRNADTLLLYTSQDHNSLLRASLPHALCLADPCFAVLCFTFHASLSRVLLLMLCLAVSSFAVLYCSMLCCPMPLHQSLLHTFLLHALLLHDCHSFLFCSMYAAPCMTGPFFTTA